MGSGHPTLGLLVCMASTLSAEPFPQPKIISQDKQTISSQTSHVYVHSIGQPVFNTYRVSNRTCYIIDFFWKINLVLSLSPTLSIPESSWSEPDTDRTNTTPTTFFWSKCHVLVLISKPESQRFIIKNRAVIMSSSYFIKIIRLSYNKKSLMTLTCSYLTVRMVLRFSCA